MAAGVTPEALREAGCPRKKQAAYFAKTLEYVLQVLGKGPEDVTPEEVFEAAFFKLNYDWRVAREVAKALITFQTGRRPLKVTVSQRGGSWEVVPEW